MKPLAHFLKSSAGRATLLSVVTLAILAGAIVLLISPNLQLSTAVAAAIAPAHETPRLDIPLPSDQSDMAGGHPADAVIVSKEKALAIGLETVPVVCEEWPESLAATGRLELNEGRVAQVMPLVDGVVREVLVELGQSVTEGQIIAYIDSREVGEAKLRYLQDRLHLQSLKRTSQWYAVIHENTSALMPLLESNTSLDEIAREFKNRPVGAYRQQLVSALAQLKKSEADFRRVEGLGKNAVIPEKEVVRARSEYEIAAATYRALVEQIGFDAREQALKAEQQVQAAEASLAVSRAQLLILGYTANDVESMDPIQEAQRVAYYPLRSPITGKVIARSCPLAMHVDDDTQLFQIADLQTLWLRADVFEKDIDAAVGLEGREIIFRTGSYPAREFTARVFSAGDLVDDATRATRLLALTDNSDGLLKAGMFVDVQLNLPHAAAVIQVPAAAIQRHANTTFVFVSDGIGSFEKRDVSIGRTTPHVAEILTGLTGDEQVVAHGAFAVKSEMLKDMMAEE